MDGGGEGVGRFFDKLSDDYTGLIEQCFPRYREMLWAVLDYLPGDLKPASILDLGCGTGNLTVLLAAKYPDAAVTAVDVSSESLEACRQRLAECRLTPHRADFRELQFPPESFDLVASNIALHHIRGDEKRVLFAQIFHWLRPQGVFVFADQFAGASASVYQRHIENWREATKAAGSTDQQWSMWMEHQRLHDHHDTLADQLQWMQQAGFVEVDCPWRYLLWTVLQGRKL